MVRFVCLRAALSDVMSVSFRFVSLISFAVTTALLMGEKKEGKQHIKKKRLFKTFGYKKLRKKLFLKTFKKLKKNTV